jgi:hypothetical protein
VRGADCPPFLVHPKPCRCRQLDDEFRLQYARMWQALVMADEAGIRSAAAGMGAGETTELFAGVLTQRPWSQASENRYLRSTPPYTDIATVLT